MRQRYMPSILRGPVRLFRPAFFLTLLVALACSSDLPIAPEESEYSAAGIKLNAEAVTFNPTFIGRTDTFQLVVEYGDTVDMVLLISLSDSAHFSTSPDSFFFTKKKKTMTDTLIYTPSGAGTPDLGYLYLLTYNFPDTVTGLPDTVGMDSVRMSGVGSGQFLDLELSFVRGGTFTMGVDSLTAFEDPGKRDQWGEHEVTLNDFFIGRYEVTNLQYYEFWSEVKPEHTPEDTSTIGLWPEVALKQPNFPVIGVNWHDAIAFCRWLSLRTGESYTLPTEAQWQYAASGGANRQYPWSLLEGETPDSVDPGPLANTRIGADGYTYTAPVDAFVAGESAFGVLNMSGNVWEWCQDWYDPDYYRAGYESWIDPQGSQDPDHDVFKVVRGGSWSEDISQATCTNRAALSPENREIDIGFRVVRNP